MGVALTRLSTIAILEKIFSRNSTAGNKGAWKRDSGGSTSSGGTGPGTNSGGPYVYSESSGAGQGDLPKNSVLSVLPAVMSAWTGAGRVLTLRASMQGTGSYDSGVNSGLQIQGRAAASDAWATVQVLNGWTYSNTLVSGSTVTDSRGATVSIVQAGGWADFSVTIPDTYTQLRIRNIAQTGNIYRHDAALWQVEFKDGTAAPGAPTFSDNTGNAQSWVQNTGIGSITVPAAAGAPTPTYAAVGSLPAGISFNPGTRVLSGTPTATGSGTIRIRATNSAGSADWTVTYAVAAAPVIVPPIVVPPVIVPPIKKTVCCYGCC